jgi:hypothetical protein
MFANTPKSDTLGYMNPVKTNNERLRELIAESGLTQPVALTIFNRGLGVAGYSFDAWKSFLVSPESKKFRPLKDELLAHAEKTFAKFVKSA